uniref:Uncharacterized protein n=1 Tax=viral metagenome TaxID=1070528 RepID=A0A6C0J4J7_9ZZZZ
MAQICFDTYAFLTFIFIGVSIMIYTLMQIYTDSKNSIIQLTNIRKREHKRNIPVNIKQNSDNSENNVMIPPSLSRDTELDMMIHPMIPPVRRGYAGNMGTLLNIGNMPVNISTRGEYGEFHMMGYLHNATDQDQAMSLMGRRIHSNKYEYYTFHHNNPNIKIPINQTKEINDGDSLTLNAYPNTSFTVSIYDTDSPKYVPY